MRTWILGPDHDPNAYGPGVLDALDEARPALDRARVLSALEQITTVEAHPPRCPTTAILPGVGRGPDTTAGLAVLPPAGEGVSGPGGGR